MNPLDRIIFSVIALSLAALALQPLYADAGRYTDVNIAAVGGYAITGRALPTK